MHWIARFDLAAHFTPIQLLATTFGVAFISGFLPLINIEAFLVSAVVLGGASNSLGLVAAATLGQMAAKSLLYFSGRGLVALPLLRHLKKMERVEASLRGRTVHAGGLLFVSAMIGFPPFYALSILAGSLRIPFTVFLAAGVPGRFIRFALFTWFPQLVQRWAA